MGDECDGSVLRTRSARKWCVPRYTVGAVKSSDIVMAVAHAQHSPGHRFLRFVGPAAAVFGAPIGGISPPAPTFIRD